MKKILGRPLILLDQTELHRWLRWAELSTYNAYVALCFWSYARSDSEPLN